MEYETIVVERPDPRIARIVMNRPEARNAQNLQMTYDLNAAFDWAVQDDAVKVIILAGFKSAFLPHREKSDFLKRVRRELDAFTAPPSSGATPLIPLSQVTDAPRDSTAREV